MRAILQDVYGPEPEDVLRLAEIHPPSIGDNEVLVRVQAASVDRGTWHVMAGLPYPIRLAGFGFRRPKYPKPGRRPAGKVEAGGARGAAVIAGGARVCARGGAVAPDPPAPPGQ